MNKLQTMLNGDSAVIKGKRAENIAEDMMFAQKKIVDQLEEVKRGLERQLTSLNDLYPESELSLLVAKKDFNADAWATETQRIKVQLAMNKVELETAKETYTEWFSEEKAGK